MAHLDDELAQALKDSEERAATEPTVAPVAPAADRPGPKASRGSLGLLVGLLVVGGSILSLVLTNVDGSAIYSKGVDELLAQQDRLKDRTIKVTGVLVKGTLVSNLATRGRLPCEYRFKIEKNGQVLPVRFNECVVPDTFKDDPTMNVEVTATGKMSPEGFFQAESIMAKCPSKYEMRERAAAGEVAPHGPKGPGTGALGGAYAPVGRPLEEIKAPEPVGRPGPERQPQNTQATPPIPSGKEG